MRIRTALSLSLVLVVASLIGTACAGSSSDGPATAPRDPQCIELPPPQVGSVVPVAEMNFDRPFGPDAPVEMATIWGDRETGAHATVGTFPAGFDSGPHTHTGAYFGVVVSGIMTNPFGTETNPVEMGPGSVWFVPAGEQHATRCLSEEPCVFFFHAEDKFDFLPIEELTERRSSDALAMSADSLSFEIVSPFVSMAAAFGDRSTGSHGTIGRFTARSTSPEHIHSEEYVGVVLTGTMTNPFGDKEVDTQMTAGGVWVVPAGAAHRTACVSDEDCLFYFFSAGAFDFTPICG